MAESGDNKSRSRSRNRSSIRAAAPASEQERLADQWADEAILSHLPRLRTSAAEWQKAVASLAGLLGAGTLLNADSAVRALSPGWRIGYGVAAGLALVLAGSALALASVASQNREVEIPPDLGERLQLYNKTVEYTCSRLQLSRRCTALAAVALIISFAIRWYGPS